MSGILRLLGMSILSVGACLFAVTADAATGRANSANIRSTTIGGGSTTARMPSMPTLPLIAVGNISTNVPSGNTNAGGNNGGGNNGGGNNGGGTHDVVCWVNVPHATAGAWHDDGYCRITECADGWMVNDNFTACVQAPECPDGGPRNSDYTIDDCMREVYACINNGALPNGLNDMFNADLRASIINGMGLCYAQVDKCLTNVRRNCKPVYITRADVWIDFNSRKVQPEYYSFVLRKTGLTPTQAENTCLLLDRNTYGKSFAAVNANDVVTGEYKQGVGAYNEQVNGSLSKDNPMGATINTDGEVDAKRGHYARWDASNAQCLIRVAAYNKDKLITNEWLFGAIGDDAPAEVWKVAGETFTCNKDLFGFSLMKQTATAALVGVAGGTVVGAAVGAGVGAGIANKNMNICTDKKYRDDLLVKIKNSGKMNIIENFLKKTMNQSTTSLSQSECEKIIELPDIYNEYDMKVSVCEEARDKSVVNASVINCGTETDLQKCLEGVLNGNGTNKADLEKVAKDLNGINADNVVSSAALVLSDCVQPIGETNTYTLKQNCGNARDVLVIAGIGPFRVGSCVFKGIDLSKGDINRNIACTKEGLCRPYTEIREELNQLQSVLDAIEVKPAEKRGATIGKATGIGAAVGAGAGGIATAITALVESDNINCRVGDGLGQVGLNKSYSIDGLKDLYVKWNLNLPDTQVLGASGAVTDEASWKDACDDYVAKKNCEEAQFYYKNASGSLEWIYSACAWDTSTNTCNPNNTLLKSYGVIE